MAAPQLTVLVLAVGGNVSQGILKALTHGEKNYRVLGADISPLQMGLYTVDHAFISPWATEAEFLPWLLDICRRESVDVVLSGAESVLMTLARHRDKIVRETGAVVLVSDFDVMETGDDKLKTCRWLRAAGLSCPAFAASDDPGAVDTLRANAPYPFLAKPRRGGGARGHFLIEDDADLDYARRKHGYLLQERIGTPKEEYTVGCFMDQNGRLATSCCMRRELLAGTTYRATLGEFPEVRAEAERIVGALKPVGPCNIQLRVTKNGPVCFEINPRFSGTTSIRSHFGYNEVQAAIDSFVLGKPVNLPRITEGVALRYWNELYVDPAGIETVDTAGELTDPTQYAKLELWGAQPRPIRRVTKINEPRS